MFPDQEPSLLQKRSRDPINWYPLSQVKLAWEPNEKPQERLKFPCNGSCSVMQDFPVKIKFSYVELMQFQALYYPCIKHFCIFKKETIDLLGNNFACDSLEDKYNKTRNLIGCIQAIYKHLSKAMESKQLFSKGIFNVTCISMTYLPLAPWRYS